MKAQNWSWLAVLLLSVLVATVEACPWCKRYGIKETVSANEPDPGGRIFGEVPPVDKTRRYFVAAEPVVWTWVPSGTNTAKPLPLPPDIVAHPTAAKVRYVEYTDATFTERVTDTPRLGILGPVFRGVVGEYLAVTFRNNSPWPLSMHPHGVRYDKDSEGAYAEPGPGKGAAVGPGATFTYVWQLDEASGPQPGEPSSKCWLYHSHCKDDEEINLGLFGFIVVTDPKRARPDGTPADVDREMATVFSIFDETPEDELLEYRGPDPLNPGTKRPFLQTLELQEISGRHSINGLLFGNLSGLEMRQGERTRWYLGALGEENGIHTAHWHGARVREEGRRVVDVISLLPGETKVADQMADNPGSWLVHCHVSDHMMEGMFATYHVRQSDEPLPPEPFLGLRAKPSIAWRKADVLLDLSKGAASAAKIQLDGIVSIHRGFYPLRNTIAVRLGEHRVTLAFTDKTMAKGEGAICRVRGGNAAGVFLGEQMEFEFELDGPAWRSALANVLEKNRGTPRVDVPAEIELGTARHSANLSLQIDREGNRVRGTLNPAGL